MNISEMNLNGSLTIYNIFPIQYEISNYNINIPFKDQITDSIRRGIVVAASDISIKDYYMRGYLIIIDINCQRLLSNKVYHQQ